VHWVRGEVRGTRVHGAVAWPRRFDHMQQHTGQHILSEAFLKLLGAQTVSFHLGAESCTVDVERPSLEAAQASAVEDLANEVVFNNLPIIARFVRPDELPAMELRKAPAVTGDIRIVEVEGFDRSPCGGTHCSRAGEVGPIAIRKWERRGQEVRVEFVCGWRAVHDYRWKTASINELAQALSVKDRELAEAVRRALDESAGDRRELNRLKEEMLGVEAERCLAAATLWNDVRLVVRAFESRDPQEVRGLALRVARAQKAVALLGAGGVQARLFFARSEDVQADMAALLKRTYQAFGGSGGGQPHLAQGGGMPGDRVDEALHYAEQALRAER
jgi:alanyl-tRNA synthetase